MRRGKAKREGRHTNKRNKCHTIKKVCYVVRGNEERRRKKKGERERRKEKKR